MNTSSPHRTAQNIIHILKPRGLTVSVAESITAGNLQSSISSVPGASSSFVGGITTYEINSKVNILGVNRDSALSSNCVSQDVADQMAVGAQKLFNTDISIATCGYAEESEENAVSEPFAYISIVMKSDSEGENIIHRFKANLAGNRVEAQRQATQIALTELLRVLDPINAE